MLSIIELTRYLKQGVSGIFYPNNFPASAVDDCSHIAYTGGTPTVGGVGKMNIQVQTRSVEVGKAEQQAMKIRAFLEDTGFYLGSTQVIIVKTNDILPLYLGEDENGRHIFSVNYQFTVGV
ncbi:MULTISPECIES: minor capsid protein [unclassified Exiguobacterium]|uniref:minor capsid protein n=1 Tax=unclassified Exiguobacterium TaxID=2644629 RepID=UPI001BE71F11|nr:MULTISPECIES: minor capsid protein [unclassified Exiguobacterium]